MIRRVVLIYPAARRYTGLLSTHRLPGLVMAHTGLPILAEIRDGLGSETVVHDEQVTPFSEAMVTGADLVGISIQTAWSRQGYRIARAVRRLGKPVVMGGAHATLNPDEAMEAADYVVRGEGEKTLPELIEVIDGRREPESVLGLSYRENGRVFHNPPRPLLTTEELDRVPWPRLDRIEGFTDRRRFPWNRRVYATMLTRGCDQACTYCSITRVFGRGLRHRSPANVIEELGSRFDPRRQFLFFMDDSLAVDRDFLKEVLDSIRRLKLVPRLGWHSQMRADVADDPELLRLMKETNCLFVTCGFESVSDASLRSLGKGQSAADVARAIERLSRHRVLVNGFFMFGTDHDGPECFDATVRFARSAGCLMGGFMPVTPFPGTPMFRSLDAQGRIFTRDCELYDVQHVVYRPARMSALDLYWRTLACYPAFYGKDHLLRLGRFARGRGLAPSVLATLAGWFAVKDLCWSREVLANLDYMAALRRFERAGPGATFPDLGERRLWAKDLLSGRTLRRLAWHPRLGFPPAERLASRAGVSTAAAPACRS
ncbi:MAG: B12-binding domain-containing radical SAM protein [Planctomycetes bacterium]|nr:B12-binding domain-containing radical SAM protein [Planctomycetota bacterium]